MKPVERRDDRDLVTASFVYELGQILGERRLSCSRWSGDPEQEPRLPPVDASEQLARERYSLLDLAQRLMSLSVA